MLGQQPPKAFISHYRMVRERGLAEEFGEDIKKKTLVINKMFRSRASLMTHFVSEQSLSSEIYSILPVIFSLAN